MCVHVLIFSRTVLGLPCFKRLLVSRNIRVDRMLRIDSSRTASLTSCRITSKPSEENNVAHPCPIKPAPTQAILLIPISVPPLSYFSSFQVILVFKKYLVGSIDYSPSAISYLLWSVSVHLFH